MEEKYTKHLSDEQKQVVCDCGTEAPFTGKFHDHKGKGMYVCVACGTPLFDSSTKFDSGTGWPSFSDSVKDAIDTKKDFKLVVPRTEIVCKKCGGHLGHVFNDGPKPTGKRYCVNSASLDFKEK